MNVDFFKRNLSFGTNIGAYLNAGYIKFYKSITAFHFYYIILAVISVKISMNDKYG